MTDAKKQPMPLVDARVDFEMPNLADLVPYQPTGPLDQLQFTNLLNLAKLRREVIQRVANIKTWRGRWKRANAELLQIEADLQKPNLPIQHRLDLQGRYDLAQARMWEADQMCQQEELEMRCFLMGFQDPEEGEGDGV